MRKYALRLAVVSGILGLPLVASAEPLVGLTLNNELVRFDSATPNELTTPVAVTGLQANETLHAIDFRPSNGKLYGLGSSSRLYVIDVNSGAATAVGDAPFATALDGVRFGFDFNPTGEAVRVTSDTRQNLRINADTGAIAATDSAFTYTVATQTTRALLGQGGQNALDITAIAYTNSRGAAASTTLYGLDANYNELVRIEVPALGQAGNFHQVIPIPVALLDNGNTIGLNFDTLAGLDISNATGTFFAVLNSEGADPVSSLWTIDATTGVGTKVADLTTRLANLAVDAPIVGRKVFAVTENNRLVTFDTRDPSVFTSSVDLTGNFLENESIVGIDFRPADGKLFGVSNLSRLHVIDVETGVATAVGTEAFTPALTGNNVGVDFNPTVDRLRVVSGTQNLRINPADGVATADTALAYVAGDTHAGDTPRVSAAGYTNSVADAQSTRLYVLDRNDGVVLASQGAAVDGSELTGGPNGGLLASVGSLGVSFATNTDLDLAFDIDPDNNAFAVVQTAGGPRLYGVNLDTGRASQGWIIGTAETRGAALRGIAIGEATGETPDGGTDGGSSGASSSSGTSGNGGDGGASSGGTSGNGGSSGTSGTSGSNGNFDDPDGVLGGGSGCSTTDSSPWAPLTAVGFGALGLALLRRRRSR